MPEIIVYFASDGTATIRMLKGTVPDRSTIERLSKLIGEHRKNPTHAATWSRVLSRKRTSG